MKTSINILIVNEHTDLLNDIENRKTNSIGYSASQHEQFLGHGISWRLPWITPFSFSKRRGCVLMWIMCLTAAAQS